MNRRTLVLIAALKSLAFLLLLRTLSHPRAMVYVVSAPYGLIAALAVPRNLWIKISTGLRRVLTPQAAVSSNRTKPESQLFESHQKAYLDG